MLIRLKIENLILVEEAEIQFGSGLNVITGETGAGKTAVLRALTLLTGAKVDGSLVREGKEKARVVAEFQVPESPAFFELLRDAGIELDRGEDLILLRELTSDGKSKAYLNNQPVTATLLKQLSPFFIRLVKQQTSQLLRDPEEQRALLDAAAHLESDLDQFRLLFLSCRELEKRLEEMKKREVTREREEARLLDELEEIKALSLRDGELEALESELKDLASSSDYINACRKIGESLSDEVLSLLGALRSSFDLLVKLSPKHEEERRLFEGARIELKELAATLLAAAEKRDVSEAYLESLGERISEIKKACRKWGGSVSDILSRHYDLEEELKNISMLGSAIHQLEQQLGEEKAATDQLAKRLTKKRHKSGELLAESVHRHLAELGMEKARFSVHLEHHERRLTGDDAVQFFLAANVGEKAASLSESVSGGELARVLLALETYFAKEGGALTMIFDEIDANIGGVTATLVGKKLKELAKERQLILITHFPQVAQFADHHLTIAKSEKGGRTLTTITKLSSGDQENELKRMAGFIT